MRTSTGKTTPTQVAKGQVERTCEHCQTVFWCYPSKVGRFCSRVCKDKVNGREVGAKRLVPRTDPQTCTKCGETYALKEYPVEDGRPALRCRECVQPPVAKRRMWHLKKKFGITVEQWMEMYQAQGGHCPICLKILPDLDQLLRPMSRTDAWSERDWNTDHCHVTLKVRAILHRKCNMGLGCFDEDPATMRRAADYIEAHLRP